MEIAHVKLLIILSWLMRITVIRLSQWHSEKRKCFTEGSIVSRLRESIVVYIHFRTQSPRALWPAGGRQETAGQKARVLWVEHSVGS